MSAYICRTKQWSFFFWYYYIHGIEKTIYYGSKRATTKERELTCLLKMTFYILEFQRFLKNIKLKEQYYIMYNQELTNQRTCSFPHVNIRRACRQTTFSTELPDFATWKIFKLQFLFLTALLQSAGC